MSKKYLWIIVTLCILVCMAACSQRGESKIESSSTGESAFNSAIAEESSTNESLSEPPSDWPADWPEKYKTFDKYLVTQPKNTTIKTYLFDLAKQNYNIISHARLHDYFARLSNSDS